MELVGHGRKRNHTIFYNCQREQRAFRFSFVGKNNIKQTIVGFEPINPRLYKLRIKGKYFYFIIINCHVPKDNKNKLEKTRFMKNWKEHIDNVHDMTDRGFECKDQTRTIF